MKKPKLTLAVYGIGRMPLDQSDHYLELAELLGQHFQVSFIEVRNDIGEFSNPRSGETNSKTRNESLFVNAFKIIRDFRDVEHKELLELSTQYNDVHDDGYISNSNLIQQLLMLREISTEIKKLSHSFVLCIRDDLSFNPETLASNCITNIPTNMFLTSAFHSNCGICERFVFGSIELVEVLLQRLNSIEEFLKASSELNYSHSEGLNGEWLMRYIVEKHNFLPICAPLFTKRYRATGNFAKERISLRPQYLIRETASLFGLLRHFKFKLLRWLHK
jgi:hypothetical protein